MEPTSAPVAAHGDLTRESLEAFIALQGEGSIPADARRDAFARYEELSPVRSPQSRYWKHDYAKLGSVGLLPSTLERTYDAIHPGGVTVTSFHHARAQHPGVFEQALGKALVGIDDPFTALTVAFQNIGRFIHVPAGVVVDHPIMLNLETTERFPYTLVVLGEDAQATIIEEIAGTSTGPNTMFGICELVLAERAQLTYASLQQSGDRDRIFMTRRSRCGAQAQVRWAIAELGSALARTTLRSTLDHTGASAEITAVFLCDGQRHIDLSTNVDHIVGSTQSQTLVKSAATDHGQGRYYGNITIRADARGAQASLRDDTLLLSKDAHIDTIPALEIASNDVKAYHGATVGSIDPEELFYIVSRGIPRPQAERMITLGFFEPALERFPGNALRERIRTTLEAKLG